MVKITGEYQGEFHCIAIHDPSGNTLTTDAPKDNRGRGEAFSPTDLIATSLASCILTTMALIASRYDIELRGTRVEVVKEMSSDAPRRVARLPVEVWVPLRRSSLSPVLAGLLERVGDSCPVGQSLHPSIEKPCTVHWLPEA